MNEDAANSPTRGSAPFASGTRAAYVARQRVTDIAVSDGGWIPEYEDDDEGIPEAPGYVYVWPSASGIPLDEMRLYLGKDIEQWFDDSGFEWPPAVRAQLVSQLPRSDRERRRIVAAGELGHQVDEGIAAVVEHNDPPVFYRRASLPYEIKVNEKGVPYAALVTVNRMRDRQRNVANWVSATDIPVKPPADVCAIMLESPELHLPPLDTIVEHPVMSRHGISTRRGYDRESATYFAPSIPLPSLDVPGHPDDFQLRVALSWFDELLADFVFRSPADKANALAMMLTPIVRPLIDGGVPLAAIRAVKAGTGKTILVKAMLRILTGRDAGFTSLGTDENEAEKRLLADLLAGGQFVILDNIETGTVLKSAALARALTTGVLAGRIITTSKHVSLPVRCTWVATGNNLTMSDEIARRSYMIEFSPELERPDLRDASAFLHPDLLGWVGEKRPELLSALLTIAQAWYAEGMPLEPGPVLSSFEEWSRIMAGILKLTSEVGWEAGRHFLGNEARKREIAEDGSAIERETLLRVVNDVTAGLPFTWKRVHEETQYGEHASEMGAAAQPFLDRVEWTSEQAVVQIGYAVRPWIDGVYGGLRFVRDGKGKYGQRLRVVGIPS